MDDVLIKGLNADTKIVDVKDVENYYSQFDPWAGARDTLEHLGDILSEKMTPEQKSRAMTFIRGFYVSTTTDEIRAALVSHKPKSKFRRLFFIF